MDQDIQAHFQHIYHMIRQGKSGAWQAVNAHVVMVNWQIGAYLSRRLTENTYGDKVVHRLAQWLSQQEHRLTGYDRRSLYRMRAFFEAWQGTDWTVFPSTEIVATASPQSLECPPLLLKLSWSHHIELITESVSQEERIYYLLLAIKERYHVRELRRQMKSGLFERQMLAHKTLILPEHPQKDLLPGIFRDRYMLEFLQLQEPYSEFDLKKALIAQMKQFLLELGRDFLFIGEEMRLQAGMQDYYTDMVFFHRELQCLVAFELKIESFKPEHLGKMNFYLELLDREMRKPHENPSIGVLLCKTKNDEVVEIAMSRQLSPALVAVYETKFVDRELLRRMLHEWTANWEQTGE